MLTLTSDQIAQLQALGIDPNNSQKTISNTTTNDTIPVENTSQDITPPPISPPTLGNIPDQTISSSSTSSLPTKPKNPIVPILSISGLTFLSFGGLIYFKNQTTAVLPPSPEIRDLPSDNSVSPTQVPKSIQHYLLTSQQFFTQALELQTQNNQTSAVENINQAISTASEAIKEFPSDSRAYEQRGRIYVSLIESQPQLLTNAISDLSHASRLNPDSAEITRTLATLYAKKGDAQNTLTYLNQTVNLEPTKAQNFYDLAHLQQQTGLLPEALATYNRLLTIVSDPTQKSEVIAEKSAIEKLLQQNPSSSEIRDLPSDIPPSPDSPGDGPLLQANTNTGPIIAAPETSKDITVSNLSTSNSLAGTGVLPANTKQISISNTNLTSTSQVYLTVTKGGKNLTLQVLSKSKDSFIVGLDSPTAEDIEFKWWIIK